MGGLAPAPPDLIVLESGWLSPSGVSTQSAEQIRRRYALRMRWTVLLLVALPVLGVALIGLAATIA